MDARVPPDSERQPATVAQVKHYFFTPSPLLSAIVASL
jgi:hypothetical protein